MVSDAIFRTNNINILTFCEQNDTSYQNHLLFTTFFTESVEMGNK